jgi:hypothetical protein
MTSKDLTPEFHIISVNSERFWGMLITISVTLSEKFWSDSTMTSFTAAFESVGILVSISTISEVRLAYEPTSPATIRKVPDSTCITWFI